MIDLHTHSIFSDGDLIPAELAQRAYAAGYKALAITDHADHSNIDFIIPRIIKVCLKITEKGNITALPGIELTHVDPLDIADRELAHHQRADSIAQQDQRHRHRKGEGAQDAIDGKGGVDDLQIENLAPVREPVLQQVLFGLRGVLPETVRDEEGRGRAHPVHGRRVGSGAPGG